MHSMYKITQLSLSLIIQFPVKGPARNIVSSSKDTEKTDRTEKTDVKVGHKNWVISNAILF